MNKINHIIYCIIDDLRATHFFDFIEKGLLPNFKKIMENGIYSKSCITDFPSVTYPTQPTQITGTYTGDYRHELCHGVPSYNWMGRYYAPPILRSYGGTGTEELIQIYKMNSDLRNNCQTFLEMTGEGNHTSITQFISRGTDWLYPERKTKLAAFFLALENLAKKEKYAKTLLERANTLVVKKLIDNFKNPKKYFGNKEAPIGSNLWFMSSDVLMHLYGFDHFLYILNLIHIDKVMGLLVDELDKMGYLADTVIAITADHGNFKGEKKGDLNLFYNANALTPYHPRKNIKGTINIAEFGGVGLFYFKGSEGTSNKLGWSTPSKKDLENYGPKRVNLFETLFQIEGTELMYYREDGNRFDKGTIHLKKKDKKTGKIITSMIEYTGTGETYKTKYISDNNEDDIFGYSKDPIANKILDGKFHTIKENLELTNHVDFPLYTNLIPRHFKNPRSSDIIMSTDGSVVYGSTHGENKEINLYTHDIGLRCSSVVPLLIGGSPEIPHKEIKYCKTTDIVPTIIEMLGKKPHKSVVGKNLI